VRFASGNFPEIAFAHKADGKFSVVSLRPHRAYNLLDPDNVPFRDYSVTARVLALPFSSERARTISRVIGIKCDDHYDELPRVGRVFVFREFSLSFHPSEMAESDRVTVDEIIRAKGRKEEEPLVDARKRDRLRTLPGRK